MGFTDIGWNICDIRALEKATVGWTRCVCHLRGDHGRAIRCDFSVANMAQWGSYIWARFGDHRTVDFRRSPYSSSTDTVQFCSTAGEYGNDWFGWISKPNLAVLVRRSGIC